jgi:hypothetical protein
LPQITQLDHPPGGSRHLRREPDWNRGSAQAAHDDPQIAIDEIEVVRPYPEALGSAIGIAG